MQESALLNLGCYGATEDAMEDASWSRHEPDGSVYGIIGRAVSDPPDGTRLVGSIRKVYAVKNEFRVTALPLDKLLITTSVTLRFARSYI